MKSHSAGTSQNGSAMHVSRRLALSAWDLHRQWPNWGDSQRAKIMMLRTRQRLQGALEASREIPPEERSIFKIQDDGRASCLLVHGLQGSPGDLAGLTDYLHQRGLTVYAPILPLGERASFNAAEVMWRTCLQDVEQRYELLSKTTGRVFVVGHGFGAALAVHLARKHSPAGLALLSPALIPRVSIVERLFLRLKLHRLRWLRPRMGWTPEVLEGMESARTQLGRLRLPVYAAQCEDDDRISPISLRVLQKRARHRSSRFRAFPSGGHDILVAHGAETLHEEIAHFFKSLA